MVHFGAMGVPLAYVTERSAFITNVLIIGVMGTAWWARCMFLGAVALTE